MSATILVVHPNRALSAQFRQALMAQSYAVEAVADMSAAAAKIAQSAPNLLVVAEEVLGTTLPKAISALRNTPRTAVLPIIVLIPNTASARVMALEAGTDGYLLLPVDERELVATVRVVLERASRLQQQTLRQPGKVITFFSAKGGVGTTSLCVNTAASLALQQNSARVVCVDLSLPLGSIGDLIGIEPTETIATLSNLEQAQLNPIAVNTALATRAGLGFETLLGSRDLAEAQTVNPVSIEPILRHLQGLADFIFVDVGRNVSRISLPILKLSHRVVLVLATDANSLRLNQVALNYFKSLGIPDRHLVLVVNRAVGLAGKSPEEAEQLLQHAIFATVPYERDRFTVASNMGNPLVLKEPHCPAAMTLQSLAQHLLQS